MRTVIDLENTYLLKANEKKQKSRYIITAKQKVKFGLKPTSVCLFMPVIPVTIAEKRSSIMTEKIANNF